MESDHQGQRSLIKRQDRPVFVLGSGRCGSTLLQRLLNTSPEFLIWGEHAGILRQITSAFATAANDPQLEEKLSEPFEFVAREERLRDLARWPGWDNALCKDSMEQLFRRFIQSLFLPPDREPVRWGFKEIRYGWDASDPTLQVLHHLFPAAQTIILIRDPFQTVESTVISWWGGLVNSPSEIDKIILDSAELWAQLYERLFLFYLEHRATSLLLKYEDISTSSTRDQLMSFLEPATPFTEWDAVLGAVQQPADRGGEFGKLVKERMLHHRSALARLTARTRALYGYRIEEFDSVPYIKKSYD